jgi:Ca-activated chloride channel family protein
LKIDPGLRGQTPRVDAPVPFCDGAVKGWRLRLPGSHPLATPAVVDGRVYVGGGFGSYDFFALDAATGSLAWHYQTEDDGPTAAVVAEDCVVFNTESCELEVLSTAGRRIWKKWLGDPLLSMPAVANGRVFMAFPDTHGDHRHYLACFGLNDGQEFWRQPIAGEIITCPVLADGAVYLTTLDGTLACFAQTDGQPRWQESRNATSAPAVWREQCYFSQRREGEAPRGGRPQQTEHLSSKFSAAGTPTNMFDGTVGDADYLDHEKRQRGSAHYRTCTDYDAGVGFAGHKGDSKIHQAMHNLGQAQVSAVWAYQGSKPFVARGRVYSGLGDTVHAVDPQTREVFWKQKLRDSKDELLDSWLTPPAVVNGKLFLGTIDGRVVCLSADTGATLWSATVGEPVLFQPAVVRGCVYAPTGAGSLFCLETGDAADDGWNMWGATAAHNGRLDDGF